MTFNFFADLQVANSDSETLQETLLQQFTKEASIFGKQRENNVSDAKPKQSVQQFLTKSIRKTSEISPSGLMIISSFFVYNILRNECESQIIIPRCVEILCLMFLGNPLCIHAYICSTIDGTAIQESHQMFLISNHQTLQMIMNVMEDRFPPENNTFQPGNDSIMEQMFNEYEYRVWVKKKATKFTSKESNLIVSEEDKEIFACIDQLIFASDMNVNAQFEDWDSFLGVEKEVHDVHDNERECNEDGWYIIDIHFKHLLVNYNIPDIEIMIERKLLLDEWSRIAQENQPFLPKTKFFDTTLVEPNVKWN